MFFPVYLSHKAASPVSLMNSNGLINVEPGGNGTGTPPGGKVLPVQSILL